MEVNKKSMSLTAALENTEEGKVFQSAWCETTVSISANVFEDGNETDMDLYYSVFPQKYKT